MSSDLPATKSQALACPGSVARESTTSILLLTCPEWSARSARALALPSSYIEWRGGRASTLAEADRAAEEAVAEAASPQGSDEELDEEEEEEDENDDEDSELASSSESDAEDVDMQPASPPGTAKGIHCIAVCRGAQQIRGDTVYSLYYLLMASCHLLHQSQPSPVLPAGHPRPADKAVNFGAVRRLQKQVIPPSWIGLNAQESRVYASGE